MRWIENQHDINSVSLLCRELRVSKILKCILSRDIDEPEKASFLWLNPKLSHFTNPFEIKDMEKAVDRICLAIEKKTKCTYNRRLRCRWYNIYSNYH